MGATVRLLRYASRHAQDPELAAWLYQHAAEEAAHPAWMLEDLKAARFGGAPTELAPDLEAIFMGLRQRVDAGQPEAVIAYLGVTECRPASAPVVKRLASVLGLPEVALRTILFHAEKDQLHRNEIENWIERLTVRSEVRGLMVDSASTALLGWAAYFNELAERLPPSHEPAVDLNQLTEAGSAQSARMQAT